MIITKTRTSENRNFTLSINNIVSGRVFAVYKTKTQFHWDGKVSITTDKGTFEYADAEAKSSSKFMTAANEALMAYLTSNNAKLPEKEVLTEEEASDRRVKFITDTAGKNIPMSDLVYAVKLPTPKITTEKLSDYEDVQSMEDKLILKD